jgi:integrase
MKYQDYDDVVGTLEDALKRQGKSESVLCSFKKSTEELRAYMESQGKDYSPGVAVAWLDTIKEGLSRERFKQLRHPQFLVASYLYGDDMMKRVFYPESQSHYDKLPLWACRSINGFLNHARVSHFSIPRLNTGACVFLLRLVQHSGIKSVGDISWADVAWYRKEFGSVVGVHSYLEYLEDNGLCSPYLSAGYNKFFAPRVILLEKPILMEDNEESYDIHQYHDAQREFLKYLGASRFSKAIICGANSFLNEFGLFLLANGLPFSNSVVSTYISMYKKRIGKCNGSFSRPIRLVGEIMAKGSCCPFPMAYRFPGARKVPAWIAVETDGYIEERKANHMSESTLQMDYHSILRFASFLDGKGCRSVTDITIPLIKEFNKNDGHATMEGKQAYNSRIRGFLRFLGRDGLVPDCLSLAVPDTVAGRVRPARILDDDQFDRIMAYCHNPDTRLLDSAILLTALETGLRVSDIIGLRFQDIDWDNAAFSIVQRKTGVHIRIPFPNGVGNAIWRYLKEERPDIPDDHVFLYPRAPFRPVGRSIVGVCLDRALKTHAGGGHITRKTFASRLLRKECPVPMISDLLGHRDDSSIDTYLDTDTSMMRRCSLPLGKTCSYEGGLL